MEIVLAHPAGYDLIPDVVELSKIQAAASGGKFVHVNSMDEAFAGADIVYPKSWAPYEVMQKRVPSSTQATRPASRPWKRTASRTTPSSRIGSAPRRK